MDSKNSLIVAGEASESDEDDTQIKLVGEPVSHFFDGAIVVGSDSESDDNFNITVEAFASKFEETNKTSNPSFNTILHKKLKESNNNLYEDTVELVKSGYRFTKDQVNDINSRLQEAQIEAEETQKYLRSSLIAMERVDWTMNDLFSTSFTSVKSVNKN